ncbi:MAG TPA: C45 family autoproteolytic acyltransferase/hydrolase [Candidatus Hydrogenedentes bacterium]|nr:C45 family autoproteolytic acyltransferase/hydrolase [Candidatus Hydrogenedentota bacterium]
METMADFAEKDLSIERSGGTLVRRKGIYIAHLRGSQEAMGRQHGELASAACGDVVPQYMNRMLRKLVFHTAGGAAGPVAGLISSFFHWRNRSQISEGWHIHLGALARAYGLKPKDAERLFIMPDLFHVLAGASFTTLTPACSCFFARGNATRDGKVIIGRNFDFFGRGVWNTNNALLVMHPEGGQRHCWIGSLGVPGSGQGFNESGLFVGMHSKFTRDLSTKGTPIFQIASDVLAECTNLEEATNRILKTRRLCGLSLFVVDTRAKDAAIVGFSARHAEVVRPEEDTLVRTNHYVTKDMQSREVGPHPFQENTHGRFQRLTELLEEKRGNLSPEDGPVLLGDCIDPFEGRKRVTGSIVAAMNNVQSVVLSPEDDALWMAHGDYPVCLNDRFRGFRISALWEGDENRYDIDDLPGGGQLDATERAALYEYEEAWSAYLDQLDTSKAVYHLLCATELLPGEPIFPRMAGLLLLKEKLYARALPLLLQNTEYDYRDPVMHAEAHVWAGRCLDLLGHQDEALKHYDIAAGLDAPPVSKAAERHRNKPFKAWQLLNISPEFIVGTALAKF